MQRSATGGLMPDGIVRTDRLCCSYWTGRVLEDISISVEAGDYVGIVGPNGSGKSTLVRALMGLCAISGGSASLFGVPCSRFSAWAGSISSPKPASVQPPIPGYCGGNGWPGPVVAEELSRRLTHADRGKVDTDLEQLDIYAIRSRLIGELSGGQQQRVLLARALSITLIS